jgi:hypothetical protein
LVHEVLEPQQLERASWGLPPLKWDYALAKTAQSSANTCIWAPSSGDTLPKIWAQYLNVPYDQFAHELSIQENHAASTTDVPNDAHVWTGFKSSWDCASGTCAANAPCNVYTALISDVTRDIGCAIATCNTGSPLGPTFPTWDFLVCLYNPPSPPHPFTNTATRAARCSHQAVPNTCVKDGIFDPEFYYLNEKTIHSIGTDPQALRIHWWKYGQFEHRVSCPFCCPGNATVPCTTSAFDPVFYGKYNPDVLAAVGSGLQQLTEHWNRYGKSEKRVGCANCCPGQSF